MYFNYTAFADEMSKIASKKEEAIYSPGVVAHEAGHAWLHRQPAPGEKAKTDIMGLARNFGPLAAGGAYAAYRLSKGKSPFRPGLAYAAAAGMTPMLVDEFGSSIRGYSELKKGKVVKQFTKKELSQERNKLIGAGATYAVQPLSIAAGAGFGRTPGKRLAIQLGAAGGAIAGLAVATGKDGPKITANEAKKLVQDIAPGTEVYTTKEPIPMGSAYLRAPKTRIGKILADAQLKAFMGEKDRKRILERGGVLLAPMNRKVITKSLMGDNALDEKDKLRRLK